MNPTACLKAVSEVTMISARQLCGTDQSTYLKTLRDLVVFLVADPHPHNRAAVWKEIAPVLKCTPKHCSKAFKRAKHLLETNPNYRETYMHSLRALTKIAVLEQQADLARRVH